MIAIILSPIYIFLNIYIVRWLLEWTVACSGLFENFIVKCIVIGIYTFFASSFVAGFFLPFRFLKLIGNYWLGIIQHILTVVLMADFTRLILVRTHLISSLFLSSKVVFIVTGIICMLLILSISIYGIIHAKKIIYSNYNIKLNKRVVGLSKMKIALVSDLHLGYNSTPSHIKKMVRMINDGNPDLVIIDGDIFDNDYKAIKDPDKIINILKAIKSKYGVFAVYGNHDIDEAILAGFTFSSKNKVRLSDPKMAEFLDKANIRLIRDDSLLIKDSFYLVGRLDYRKYGVDVKERKNIKELLVDVDKNKPIIVMDHQPCELEELAKNGVDIDLSGHTHKGQMLPTGIFGKLVWKNNYGILKINSMYSIVTSGIGVYGPNMRIGSTAEVALINIDFA